MRHIHLLFTTALLISACGSGASDDNGVVDAAPGADAGDTGSDIDQGGSDPDANAGDASLTDLVVRTGLSEASVEAGAVVVVTCEVTAAGARVDLATRVEAAGVGQLEVAGILATRAGSHEVACFLQDEALDAEADHAPATLEVAAGPADRLVVEVSPPQAVYGPGQTLTVTPRAFDAFDNPIEPAPDVIVELAPPGTALIVDELTFELTGAGSATVTLTGAGDEALRATRFIGVDAEGPAITFERPKLGDMEVDPEVRLRGEVTSTSTPIASIRRDGDPFEIDEDGEFDEDADSTVGLNLTGIVATNEAGSVAEGSAAWLYAPSYIELTEAFAPQPTMRVDVRVAADTLGDGHFDDPIDDLAEYVVGGPYPVEQDGGSAEYVASPATTYVSNSPSCLEQPPMTTRVHGWTTTATVLRVVPPTGEAAPVFTARSGGLDVAWSGTLLFEVDLEVAVNFTAVDHELRGFGLSVFCHSVPRAGVATTLYPRVLVQADVTLSGGIEIDKPSGEPVVTTHTVTATLEAPRLSSTAWLEEPLLVGVPRLDYGPFRNYPVYRPFGDVLVDVGAEPSDLINEEAMAAGLATALDEAVVAPIADHTLEALTAGLEEVNVAPAPLDTLVMEAVVDRISVGDDGVDLVVLGDLDVVPPSFNGIGRGSIMRAGCDSGDTATAVQGEETAMNYHLDLINHAMYLGWIAFEWPRPLSEADLATVAGLGPPGFRIVGGSLHPYLPPTLTDCTADGTLELQLGTVMVELDLWSPAGAASSVTLTSITGGGDVFGTGAGLRLGATDVASRGAQTAIDVDDPVLRRDAEAAAVRVARRLLMEELGGDALSVLPYLALPFIQPEVLSGPLSTSPGYVRTVPCDDDTCGGE